MNTALKRLSPLTHDVGPNKANRSVTLTLDAIKALEDEARQAGVNVNAWFRQAIFKNAKSAALRMAVAAQDRHVVCSLLALMFIVGIEVRSWQSHEEVEFRRPRVVRSVKGARKNEEVA